MSTSVTESEYQRQRHHEAQVRVRDMGEGGDGVLGQRNAGDDNDHDERDQGRAVVCHVLAENVRHDLGQEGRQ